MQQNNTYTLLFAAVVCFVCSIILTTVSSALKERQEINIEIDRKKNILKVMGFEKNTEKMETTDEFIDFYNKTIETIVVDPDGSIVKGVTPESLNQEDDIGKLPVYKSMENGKITGYAIPIRGKGLWSTLYGYFALEKNLNSVKGITFYQHGETPGLGGEIEQPWFQNNFKRKKIFGNTGELRSVSVVKGKVNDVISDKEERKFYVDGISGATMTSKGVTTLLKKSLEAYKPYFEKLRK